MAYRLIDLTMSIQEGMQTFPAPWHPFVEITQLGRHGIENRETRKIIMGTHTGTHIDAPRHFMRGGETVENISLNQLVGAATVVNLSDARTSQEIGIMDLKNAIDTSPIERLIIRFNWDIHLGESRYYTDHPFLSEEACKWLVDKGCRLIATDTPQLDNPKKGNDAPNHKILLGAGVVIVEYLVNIKEIEKKEVELIVAPLKIKDGDGAPARCFAIEYDGG